MSRTAELKNTLLAARKSRQEITCRDAQKARSVRSLLYYHRRRLVREAPELEQVTLSLEGNKVILQSTNNPILDIISVSHE